MWVFFIETVFSLGLFLNAALFIPQIIRLYQKKNSRELSLLTFAGFNLIQFFTILHGYLNHDYILMLGFGLSFISCGIVTGMIIYYRLVE
jgi:MtN3 and saliva related transmembrane protein